MQVLVNLHSAHMDPDDWQQPQQFRPERFLDQSGNVIDTDRDRVIPFSLGIMRTLIPCLHHNAGSNSQLIKLALTSACQASLMSA